MVKAMIPDGREIFFMRQTGKNSFLNKKMETPLRESPFFYCFTFDFSGRSSLTISSYVGDVLAVFCTGAYGYSMANNYNRIPRPAVVFVEDGEAQLVIQRETYEDIVKPAVNSHIFANARHLFLRTGRVQRGSRISDERPARFDPNLRDVKAEMLGICFDRLDDFFNIDIGSERLVVFCIADAEAPAEIEHFRNE